MSLSKVLEIARAELGYTESPPGSNVTKYWQAYDPSYQGQPWCVAGMWWTFHQAGEGGAFFGGAKTASCSTLLRYYKEQDQVIPITVVDQGDIVLLNFHGRTTPEHCGLVQAVVHNNQGELVYIRTVEWNTTPGDEGSQDNGGCVAAKWRTPSQVVAVCRPLYRADPEPTDYEGRWSEQAIEEAKNDGVLQGYPDGTFRPTAAVTREELAQFYLNLKRKGLLS